MKRKFVGLLLLAFLSSCGSPQEGCSDCGIVPSAISIYPIGSGFQKLNTGIYISVGNSVQWEAVNLTIPTPTLLSSDQLIWTTNRGVISTSGLYTGPNSLSPNPTSDWIKVVRKNVTNPTPPVDLALSYIQIVLLPSIQTFTTRASQPVPPGSAVVLELQFADGSGELFAGGNLLQSALTSGSNITVNPGTTVTYTLKVTNQAGDSVSRDLAVSVQ